MRAHSLTKENKIDIIGLQTIYGNNMEQFQYNLRIRIKRYLIL